MKELPTIAILAALGLSFLSGACTVPDDRARSVLESAGYSEIQMDGYVFFMCSEDDTLTSAFFAKGPSGKHVAGAVCCGLLAKGCTIRLD